MALCLIAIVLGMAACLFLYILFWALVIAAIILVAKLFWKIFKEL